MSGHPTDRIARRVVVFCKFPEPGRVKTRLAQSIGSEEAAQVARELMELTLRRLNPLRQDGVEIIVFIDPPERQADFQRWLGSDVIMWPQPDGVLDDRLDFAFHRDNDSPTDTIVVGSDCPGITSEVVADAFRQIGDRRMVFGPTADGGFYLMGARSIPDGFFRNIRWSSAVTLNELESRASIHGFDLVRLPELFDVDTHSDLQRWRMESSSERRST